jgi:hypothetical protein
MKNQALSYMVACNKEGIRVYPIIKYGSYFLEVEFNKTSEFLDRDRIGKPKTGEIRYDVNKDDWTGKILELYEKLYFKYIKNQKNAA